MPVSWRRSLAVWSGCRQERATNLAMVWETPTRGLVDRNGADNRAGTCDGGVSPEEVGVSSRALGSERGRGVSDIVGHKVRKWEA